MDSKKLEALLMATDLGSFTKAAEVLGYTQSGLTHMMNSLEKEVGFTLLDRGRSGVKLTREGEKIEPAIRDFLQANSRLDSAIERLAASRGDTIRISAYASMAAHWLPSIIQQFRTECPTVDVDIRMADDIYTPYQLLQQGRMDIIFASRQAAGSYDWIHLDDERMFAVLPMDDDAGGQEEFPLSGFEGREFIMPAQGFDQEVNRIFGEHGVHPRTRPAALDDPGVINMVAHGLGVSMMSRLMLRGRIDSVRVLPVTPPVSREIGMAVRSLADASPSLQRFIDCVHRMMPVLLNA